MTAGRANHQELSFVSILRDQTATAPGMVKATMILPETGHFGKLFAVSLTLGALTSVIEGLPIADGVQESPATVYVTAGDTVPLQCTAAITDYMFRRWIHPQSNVTEIMTDSDDRFSMRSFPIGNENMLYQLTIHDMRPEDNGTYKCVFTNTSGVAVARCIDVLYENSVEFLTPDHQMFYFLAGSNISLECRARHYEQIQWRKQDSELIPSSPSQRVHTVKKKDGVTLILTELRLQDTGIYCCVADSTVTDPTKIQTSIQVHALPSVVVTPSVATAGESNNVSFTCNATGYPLPNVVWYKEDLTSSPINIAEVSVTDEYIVSVLHLYSIQLQDSAMYYCVASNPNGSSNSSATLNIIVVCLALPEQIGAHLTGHLNINVTWQPPVCYGMEYQNTLTIKWRKMTSHSVWSQTIRDPVKITHYVITNVEPHTTYFVTVSAGGSTRVTISITTDIAEKTIGFISGLLIGGIAIGCVIVFIPMTLYIFLRRTFTENLKKESINLSTTPKTMASSNVEAVPVYDTVLELKAAETIPSSKDESSNIHYEVMKPTEEAVYEEAK